MHKSWISQRLDMRRFLQYLLNIPDGFIDHSPNSEQTRRVYLLFTISLTGIMTLIPLGILALVQKHTLVGILDMSLAFIITGNILHARRYKHYTFNIYIGISFVAMLFVYMFFTGGVNRSGAFIWYYTFPLIASFILGSKRGAVATVLILLPAIGLFLVKNPPPFLVNYNFDFKIRFISSFLMVFAFSYLFEYSRERNREELRKSHDDLEKRVEERTSALQEAVQSLQKEITERKRIEEALRESEKKFRELAENIREVFYISEQGITRYVSPAYMEIWGRTPQSLYEEPKSILDTVHPEDRDRVMRSLEKKSRGEVEEVYRIVRPDGSIRWIKDRSFPIYDDSGKTRRVVGIAADITDLKLGEEKLKYLSLHDPLTGLYNRIYFEEEMSRIEKSRYDTVGIISCDVDGLKLVNDTLGHDHGDTLLVASARVIRESFREGDLVARIGGDEFSVLLPNTTEPAVENACQRIQEAVASYNATNPELPLSISVGFAVSNGFHRNLKDVFKEADNSMYRKKLYRTQSVRSTIVKTLINTLKARDLTTEKHVIRLEKLLASMAALIGLSESTTSDLSLLAKFHDIGKVGISDSILFKKGPLTSEEWTEMKRHCEIGYRIALSASDLIPIADWILKHHEWWNGGGYPLGIKGEEIPIECRLLAIAEAYEALTSVHPYRRASPHAKAVAELLSHSGTQFDPKLLEKFVQMLETHPPESESNAPSAV